MVIEVALHALLISLGSFERADKVGLVEFGYHLTLFHFAIVIYEEVAHDTRHLRTHSHRSHRFDGSRSGNALADVGFLCLFGHEAHFLFLLIAREKEEYRSAYYQHYHYPPYFAYSFHCRLELICL